jgi:transcriptional regulator with XRE-family HTH domain
MQQKNTNLALDIPNDWSYQCGMNVLKDLRAARELTQARLAELAGTSQPQIRRLENGERTITREWAERLAPHLGISPSELLFPDEHKGKLDTSHIKPVSRSGFADNIVKVTSAENKTLSVKGDVAAGLWMEADLFDSEKAENSSLAGGDARYSLDYQYLLRIRGESLNKIAQDGDLILCLDYGQAGIDLVSGDLVVVERFRDGGHTLERTAKRVVRHNGDIELRPESTDPRFQEPVIFDEHSEEATEVRVIAKILKVIREVA